jgi:excisionase family DNA binding protein
VTLPQRSPAPVLPRPTLSGQRPMGQRPMGQRPMGQRPMGQPPMALRPATAQPTAARPVSERPAPRAAVHFLTVAEVARIMRVSKMTVYRLVHGGELVAVRVGRSFRVPEPAVREYLVAARTYVA